MKEIHTERCLLREWKKSDIHELEKIFCSAEIGHMAGFKVKKASEVARILDIFIRDSKDSLWAIADKINDKVIGWIEVHDFEGKKSVQEIGYCFEKSYWGNGIMKEVVTSVIEEFKKCGKVERLICSHFDFNNQSKRVIEKSGFTYWKHDDSKKYYFYDIQ